MSKSAYVIPLRTLKGLRSGRLKSRLPKRIIDSVQKKYETRGITLSEKREAT